MGTAAEIACMNYPRWAYVFACATAGTLFVVNYGKIICYGDCTLGTGLFALFAGYATVVAVFSDLCPLGVVVTFNHHTLGVLNDANYIVRTNLCAKTAADTKLGVYVGNSNFV
jgi:hypothetical protein